ncbi:MAG: PadR family transcriptional regulator [Chloroflexi bacterium]|nr:PadR family transcriptional regulator [Chloroflexota bacterium]
MNQLTPDETLLGLLAAQASHGYQLLACFHDSDELGRVWKLSTSQLYAVLKRLAGQGLITGSEVEAARAPARVEYELTSAGREQLQTWLYEPSPSASIRRVRVEFLSRLYVARLLNLPTIPIVQAQKTACQQEYETRLAERDRSAPGVGFLALELHLAQLAAVLHWIDRCEMSPKEHGT